MTGPKESLQKGQILISSNIFSEVRFNSITMNSVKSQVKESLFTLIAFNKNQISRVKTPEVKCGVNLKIPKILIFGN